MKRGLCIALGCCGLLTALVGSGCTTLLGDFRIEDLSEADASDAMEDATADSRPLPGDDGGDTDSATGSDGGDDASTPGDEAGPADAASEDAADAADAAPFDAGGGDAGSDAGVCTGAAAGTPCGTGKVCDGSGHCVAVCTASSCPSGCCDPKTQACTSYASQTGTRCGHAGAQCHSCAVGTSAPSCSTSNGTCAGTLIGQIGTYSDVIDLDTDGTYVYFVDAANEEVGQVSAYSLGTPVVLSGAIPALTSVIYDPASSAVLFDQQATSTTTALYKATPGSANSAVKIATMTGSPGSNSLAVSSLGEVDVVTMLSSTSVAANNCSISGSCAALNPAISSSFINGVTWPANQSEPFWADQANGKILAYSPSCGCYTNLAAGLTSPALPANDGTYVYWLQVGGTMQLQRAPIAGGPVQTLGSYGDSTQVQNLTTDGKYVYWGGSVGGVAGIYYMPVTGGVAQLLTGAPLGMPVRVHKENTTGQTVVYYGDTTNATVDKVIAPP